MDEYHVHGNKSIAVWCQNESCAVVIRRRGKHLQTMGYVLNKKLCLAAEEILYLVERGHLVVLAESSGMAEPLQKRLLYSMTIESDKIFGEALTTPQYGVQDTCQQRSVASCDRRISKHSRTPFSCLTLVSLKCYWVYSHLRNLGYIVFRMFTAKSDGDAYRTGLGMDSVRRATPMFEAYEPFNYRVKGGKCKPSFFIHILDYPGEGPSASFLTYIVSKCGGVRLKVALVDSDGTVLIFDVTEGVPERSTPWSESETVGSPYPASARPCIGV